MLSARRDWTALARGVASRLEGLDKTARVARLRDEAREHGLEPHTLRRYLVLVAFLDRLGVREEDAARLPVGSLEVVLRIWNGDPSVAARALAMVRAGNLSFRQALTLERSLKARRSDVGAPVEPSWDASVRLRERVARALGARADELVEREQGEQLDDPRFDLVQAQRRYLWGGRTVALLEEIAHGEVPGTVAATRLARAALVAAAVYDDVVVSPGSPRSEGHLARYLALARPESAASVRVLEDDREAFSFGGPELGGSTCPPVPTSRSGDE